jgi:hypothetical protein
VVLDSSYGSVQLSLQVSTKAQFHPVGTGAYIFAASSCHKSRQR